MKNQFFFNQLVLLVLLIIATISCTTQKQAAERPNILFIGIDDLRPELGAYGNQIVKSPNIDKLASEGIRFDNAHCQVPVCGASRASLLTGLLPTKNRFLNYATHVDKDAPDVVSLPAYFKNNEYHTVCLGKIFHYPNDNESQSWSEPAERLDWTKLDDGSWSWEGWHDYQRSENLKMDQETGKGPPYEWADVPDNAYTDGKTADVAVAKLKELKDKEEPFFLAVGILKPHLPFNAPQKYWDLYNAGQFSLPTNYSLPKGVPEEATFSWGELRAYYGVPKEGPVSDSMAINLIHGYFASVSYADALVGQILNALKRNELAENTVVVLWSDHGYFLGEHSFWTKHSIFELSTRVPLILSAPGMKSGLESEALVDLVDIYPTLCELVGLNLPEHLQGKSFAPIIENPSKVHKAFSYTRYQDGESIFNGKLRLTKYFDEQNAAISEMLYDHQTDPDENENVAEGYVEQKNELDKLLSSEIERLNIAD